MLMVMEFQILTKLPTERHLQILAITIHPVRTVPIQVQLGEQQIVMAMARQMEPIQIHWIHVYTMEQVLL